ncbi:MAG: alpha/beta fold hydrolase [Clostridia bacterium]|nr:alpha/beta fold hydrolase [Clostridia bacterium]
MISSKKKSLKRIGLGIVIAIISWVLVSCVVTVVIYDSTFPRYDKIPEVPTELEALVQNRQEVSFNTDENRLSGYLYKNESNGLIIIAPGFKASADDYLWQIDSLLSKGWAVFIFDTTGSCKSEGESSKGFSQEVVDLRAALDYIESNDRFGYDRLYILGHSRGAYAACSVLDEGYDISAICSISGVNSSMDAIMQPVADKIGFLAYGNYPFLWLYQAILFGNETAHSDAAKEIAESDIPVLVVQGTEDELYTEDEYSVYSYSVDDNTSNVEYYLCDDEGKNGHTNLLFDGVNSANEELMTKIDRFFKENP